MNVVFSKKKKSMDINDIGWVTKEVLIFIIFELTRVDVIIIIVSDIHIPINNDRISKIITITMQKNTRSFTTITITVTTAGWR